MADGQLPTDDGASLDAMTFEQIVAALEALTDRMAAGDIGIEEAAELYERAGRLHAAASARLASVEERVERLRETAGGLDDAASGRSDAGRDPGGAGAGG